MAENDTDIESHAAFPVLGDPADDAATGDDAEKILGRYDSEGAATKALADLETANATQAAQIEALTGSQTRSQETIDRLIQGMPAAAAPVVAEAAPAIDYSALPDPVTDREGFARGLTEQVVAVTAHEQKGASARLARDNSLNSLYSRYRSENVDLVSADEGEFIVSGIIRSESAALQARGLNPADYIAQNPDVFLKTVEDGTRKILTSYGKLTPEGMTDGETMPGGQGNSDNDGVPSSHANPAGRTAGVSGASIAAGKSAGGNGVVPVKKTGMMAELMELQDKDGLL